MIHENQHGIGTNKDPLRQAGPEKQAELFKAVSQVCNGFPFDDVLNVALNLIINGVRQSCPTWDKAETVFNDRFGRCKNILHECYDGAGKRRSVFPFHQIIRVPHIAFDRKK